MLQLLLWHIRLCDTLITHEHFFVFSSVGDLSRTAWIRQVDPLQNGFQVSVEDFEPFSIPVIRCTNPDTIAPPPPPHIKLLSPLALPSKQRHATYRNTHHPKSAPLHILIIMRQRHHTYANRPSHMTRDAQRLEHHFARPGRLSPSV